MDWNVWYDLAVQELSELSHPAKEKLVEAELARAAVPPEAEPLPASEEAA